MSKEIRGHKGSILMIDEYMETPPRIIRESCAFRDDESPEVIEARIEETRARALEMATTLGYRKPMLSIVYHPYSEADLEAGHGWRVSATNWQEALEQCIWSPWAQFTAIVRDLES